MSDSNVTVRLAAMKEPDSSQGREEDGKEIIKCRWDLVPPTALDAVADAFTFGATKHPERSWDEGRPYSVEYAAAMRHMQAWRHGCEVDEETGLHPLAHAAARLLNLIEYEARQVGTDDR